jgi:16S rRNA (cytosine1402-N4)-methyltransferase
LVQCTAVMADNLEPPASPLSAPEASGARPRRRPRYPGKCPRRFEEKYKELNPSQHADTVAKVLASGKTPAGTHRPIMVLEILEVLAPKPGEIAADCTLGYGGHAQEILQRLLPGGHLVGLDVDPLELPKTEARLCGLGFGPEVFTAKRSNFAGLPQALSEAGFGQANVILADLGVSSMQLDNPERGFSMKNDGPLDMRMNPRRGRPASELLVRILPDELANLLAENADEPHAKAMGQVLAGRRFETTKALVRAVELALPRIKDVEVALSVRRVFQGLRIAVNNEFPALDAFLRNLPGCLKPGGRVAVLTFHSGEDRRLKKAFAAGKREGVYLQIAEEIIQPSAEERRANPRSAPAKLRWARKA